jgi:toxin CcdB
MARFDVYANQDAEERAAVPYFLDVQSNHLDLIDTRVVVPLHAVSCFTVHVRGLNPVLNVSGRDVVMNTAAIGSVPAEALRRAVGNVADQQFAIQDALDTLFGAY